MNRRSYFLVTFNGRVWLRITPQSWRVRDVRKKQKEQPGKFYAVVNQVPEIGRPPG